MLNWTRINTLVGPNSNDQIFRLIERTQFGSLKNNFDISVFDSSVPLEVATVLFWQTCCHAEANLKSYVLDLLSLLETLPIYLFQKLWTQRENEKCICSYKSTGKLNLKLFCILVILQGAHTPGKNVVMFDIEPLDQFTYFSKVTLGYLVLGSPRPLKL